MHFPIVAATLLTTYLAFSQTGPSSLGATHSSQLRSYTKSPAAKTRIKTSVEDFVLWVDETKWKQEKSDNPGMLIFSHVNGEAHALVTSTPVGMPTTVLRSHILNNLKDADPNAQITFEEKRTVNGRQVLATEISYTEQGVPTRHFGYYHGGSSGSIAIVGYTAETLFSKNIGEVTEFLNGLEISDQEMPSSANRDVLPSPGSQAGPSSVGITPSPQLRSYTKTPAAKIRIKTSVEDFVLWIDETKWKQEKLANPGMLKFSHVNGEAHALVISRSFGMPTTVLRDRILSAQKEADPNAQITFEEKRTVNGRQVLATEMSGATLEGVPFRFFGYYHGGSSGSIAIVGYTAETLFSKNIGEVTEFLNGLEIADQELPSSANRASSANRDVLPSPGLLLVNSRVSIRYDPRKWEQQGTDEVGHFTFMHSSGDGYTIVNQGRIPTPIDSIPDVVWSVLKSKDPTATIVFKEMRRVNDSDVLFLRFENDLHGIPMMNCGYFYSGKSGTVQVIAFARKTHFGELEKDFMEFLNGLLISE